jgi:tetratricopeptide (TPR) repeat protein
LQRAVADGSTTAYAHFELARLSWQDEASPASLADRERLLRRAAELNPQWAWTYALLADVRSQLGQTDALELVDRAVRLEPREFPHRLTAGLVLLRAGQLAEAGKAVAAALILAANDEERQRARELQQAIERSKPKP